MLTVGRGIRDIATTVCRSSSAMGRRAVELRSRASQAARHSPACAYDRFAGQNLGHPAEPENAAGAGVAGAPPKGKGVKEHARDVRIWRLHDAGKSSRAIAKRKGMPSRQTVDRVMARKPKGQGELDRAIRELAVEL